MIKRIRIQNYRSLIDVDVELGPLTVLIGRSGTGKSNFVRAIRALRDAITTRKLDPWSKCEPLGQVKPMLTYDVQIGDFDSNLEYNYRLSVNYENIYNGWHWPLRESLANESKALFRVSDKKWQIEPKIVPLPQPDSVMLSSLNGSREVSLVYSLLSRGIGCYDFQGNVLQNNAEKMGIGYEDDGQNYIQAVNGTLDDLSRHGDWNTLIRSLSTLNPSVSGVDLMQPDRKRLQVYYRSGDKSIVMDNASESEGFRRYFATLLALYQSPAKPLCIFEHPENGIHPGALEMLAGEFKRHVERRRGQIILTTHNPQFLDHFEPEQIRVVDIENQATKIGPLASEQMEALKLNLMSPGELLTVDPARLEGQLAEVPA